MVIPRLWLLVGIKASKWVEESSFVGVIDVILEKIHLGYSISQVKICKYANALRLGH